MTDYEPEFEQQELFPKDEYEQQELFPETKAMCPVCGLGTPSGLCKMCYGLGIVDKR